ncbi:MAG: response regulator [Anaerolineales bacterium]|nr:response regulator [Anaerolineales bacterium]
MPSAIILYIEDDTLSREVFEFFVGNVLGYTLYMFPNSADFMARVLALPITPDLILLDIHMTPLDGFAMLKLLRASESYASARVVALTASVMNEEIALLKQAGFNGCVAKPIDQRTFPELLLRLLKGEAIWRIV